MPKPLVGKRQRGHTARFLKSREAQVFEGAKTTLLIRGQKTSAVVNEVLADMMKMQKPHAKLFSRKNAVLPFEDETKLEFMCQKNDAGLFVLATHNKKRPHNLVFGRMFDGHLMDMYEYGVDRFTSLAEHRRAAKPGEEPVKSLGSKPCIVFQGDGWEHTETLRQLRTLLLELYRGEPAKALDLSAADHAVVCTAKGNHVFVRNYNVCFKRSATGAKSPDVVLLDMGPSLDLTARRHRGAAPDLLKRAMKQPKAAKGARKIKNISRDELDGKMGRIHMKRQDYDKLVTRSRFKGLKRGRTGEDDEGGTKKRK